MSEQEKKASQQIASDLGILDAIVHFNLSSDELQKHSLDKKQAKLTAQGAITINTGKFTGRSPLDRFIVKDSITKESVWWGDINIPFNEDKFDILHNKITNYLSNKEIYVRDTYACANEKYRLNIRVVNEYPWSNLFAYNMFLRPSNHELENFKHEWLILNAPGFFADPEIDGTRQENFAILSFTKKIILIGGTGYTGEIKKGIFSALNFILPFEKNVLSMHCSANTNSNGDTAVFFGLSGTGKTTLSADPNRLLIGDDEHGWDNDSVFNFEGGCYAKCINLNEEAEPQIWNAIKSGAVLENVVVNKDTLKPDFDDGSLTENTRAAYPLDYIPGAVIPSVGGHPKVIIFLTADALGVLPPVSKLTKESAMFHFMSGYTSKLAGTERGIKEPKATFSACFGSPFMPRPASVYAKMLGTKILEHNTVVYLINTGWSGGPYGVGKRISIKYSRAMVTAALTGKFDLIKFRHDDTFNLDVPTECPGVPSDVLDPKNTWIDKDSYDMSAKKLAQMFGENFTKFKDVSTEIRNAGPQIQ